MQCEMGSRKARAKASGAARDYRGCELFSCYAARNLKFQDEAC